MSINTTMPKIVKHALLETVVSIGQLSMQDKRILDKYVRKGQLSKGKGGPFPMIKTVYAHPGFDFAESRRRHYEHLSHLEELDRIAAEAREWHNQKRMEVSR